MPDRFASTYPGAGGCSHKAGVKIQLEYDLLSGEFSDVKIEPGKRSDQAYGATHIPVWRVQITRIRHTVSILCLVFSSECVLWTDGEHNAFLLFVNVVSRKWEWGGCS